jgi:Peptidase family M48
MRKRQVAMLLQPLPYHVAVADHLERAESELWSWFRSDKFAEKYKTSTNDDLLRSAIRLDRIGVHARRYMLAERARDTLGVKASVVLYQMQDSSSVPNAYLIYSPGEIKIAFAGRILELLDTHAELLDLLGHEISHYKLYTEADGRYHTVDRLLHWLIQRDQCPSEFIESWRRNRLYTEIYCDIGGLIACGDLDATIRGLVKSIADFKDADAQSYLRQAQELMTRGPGATRGTTHPELHVRVLAVAGATSTPPAEFHASLQALIAGKVELGGLDRLDQAHLGRLTRELLDRVLADPTARSDHALAHAQQMFSDYVLPAGLARPLSVPTAALAAGAIDYLVYVLLDIGSLDGSASRGAMAVAANAADELGIGARFREIARLELKGRRTLLATLSTKAA